MKFIADVMLGKLAKRLRLLGFDVLYGNLLDDNELIRLSREQDRVILTRDTGLVSRPLASHHLLIMQDQVQEQLHQVLTTFPNDQISLTRCSVCNEPLIEIEKPAAKDRVPTYVYDRSSNFQECSICERVYWKGAHVRRMAMGGINKKPVR